MAAAEATFAADSTAVAEGLQLPAINMVDIAEGFLGSRIAAVTWLCDRPAPAARIDWAAARHVTHWARRGGLPGLPDPPASWNVARQGRRAALAAYRQTLPDGLDAGTVLESLLHMYHNRAPRHRPRQRSRLPAPRRPSATSAGVRGSPAGSRLTYRGPGGRRRPPGRRVCADRWPPAAPGRTT